MSKLIAVVALSAMLLSLMLTGCTDDPGTTTAPTAPATSGSTAASGNGQPTAQPTPATEQATTAPAADETQLGPLPGSVAEDREALIAVYNALDGLNWEQQGNWLSDAPLGEWSGVTTDENGRVIWLRIGGGGSGQALSGEIPPELGNLGALTVSEPWW